MTILRRMSLVASRPLLTACATLVLSACGSGGASTQATPAAQVTPTQPSYVLHEWGFIAASLADGDLRGVTGPHGLSSMPPSASSQLVSYRRVMKVVRCGRGAGLAPRGR